MNSLATTQTLDAAVIRKGLEARSRAATPTARARILLVDDEPTTIEVLEALLEEAGYANLQSTSEPDQALSMIRENRPDLVLLDLNMPGVSGFDILLQVRADAELEHTPVIILTSATDSGTKLRALELGATDFLAKPPDPSELALRLRNTLSAKAYQDQLAFYDPLTGLPNRSLFFKRLQAVLSAHSRTHPCAVMHIDLDGFKKINDSLGLSRGDALLQETAVRLSRRVRTPDAAAQFGLGNLKPTLSRVGGDEFTVLLPRVDNMESAATLARGLLREMEMPFQAGDQELFMTVSIGIADCRSAEQQADAVLKQADIAMAHAKSQGKNRYNFYSSDLNANSLRRLSLSNDLRRAIERRELYPVFQPKIDAVSGRVTGAETLLRWRHPQFGEVSPDGFIDLAEESDQIVKIGAWILAAACHQARRVQEAGWEDFNIAVNVASKQFRHPDFTGFVARVLERTGLPPSNLTLELTEGTVMESGTASVETFKRLERMGVRLSMDDFGTGYSSLGYLRRFPLHELKIDRSFVMDLGDNDSGEAIVAAVVSMAQALKMDVVAEGVETDEQARILRKINCNTLQGFLYSRPVLATALIDKLREIDSTA